MKAWRLSGIFLPRIPQGGEAAFDPNVTSVPTIGALRKGPFTLCDQVALSSALATFVLIVLVILAAIS